MTDAAGQPRLTTIHGLDDRDLTLVAGACVHRAHFLGRLAGGHYDDQVATRAGYSPDRRHLASEDAARLQFIAERLVAQRR